MLQRIAIAIRLENQALLLLLASARQKGGAGSVLEDFSDTLTSLGRALEVLVGTDLLTNVLTLLRRFPSQFPF